MKSIVDFRPKFSLTTIWSIPAPIGLTWLYLVDTEKWPLWWKYVVSVQEVDGSPTGIGNVRQYHWHTCLPYNLLLKLRVTEVLPYRRLAVAVAGDLLGSGSCDLSWNSSSEHTKIEFIWHVQPCKHWMNWFTILAKPIFIWNHNRVMQQGEQGLIRHISTTKQRVN